MNNTPRTRRIKTVFLAMRHALNDMEARQGCFDTLRELFRQFMSVLLMEKTRLEQNRIYLDPQITHRDRAILLLRRSLRLLPHSHRYVY